MLQLFYSLRADIGKRGVAGLIEQAERQEGGNEILSGLLKIGLEKQSSVACEKRRGLNDWNS
jgi:hypothetical protein